MNMQVERAHPDVNSVIWKIERTVMERVDQVRRGEIDRLIAYFLMITNIRTIFLTATSFPDKFG